MKWLLILTPFLAACTLSGQAPINVCVLAQCELQADTGDGDLDEGDQDAQVDVGLQ